MSSEIQNNTEPQLNRRPNAEQVGMPVRVFLFTIDQIAVMLNINEVQVKQSYLHYQGRSTGFRPTDKMLARNIAPEGEKPEWRVAERELIRWCKSRGFKIYDRGWSVK